MKIIKQNNQYDIYNDGLVVLDHLENDHVYQINYNQNRGFYLKDSTLATPPDKVYGNSPKLVDYILKRYQKCKHNLGVLLSGKPGQGKTLFAKIIHQHSHYPMIKVGQLPLNVIDFLTTIDQDVILLFDEFEKNYDDNSQQQWLGFFDGTTTNHFLNIVTINEPKNLNEYFFNRPSRLRYHIIPEIPSQDDVQQLLHDISGLQIDNPIIDQIVHAQPYRKFSYDELSTIAEEISYGLDLKTIQKILNINVDLPKISCTAEICIKKSTINDLEKLVNDIPDDMTADLIIHHDFDCYEPDDIEDINITTMNNHKYVFVYFDIFHSNDDYHLFKMTDENYHQLIKLINQSSLDNHIKQDLCNDFTTYQRIPNDKEILILIPLDLINNHHKIKQSDILVATKNIDTVDLKANQVNNNNFITLDKLQTNDISFDVNVTYN